MIPGLFAVLGTSGAGPAVPLEIYSTVPSNLLEPATPPLLDEHEILTWVGAVGATPSATQATAAQQPFADDDVADGAFLLRFDDDDNLVATPALNEVFIVAIGESTGSRVLISRDTTQPGTTKAAYELEFLEDLL